MNNINNAIKGLVKIMVWPIPVKSIPKTVLKIMVWPLPIFDESED